MKTRTEEEIYDLLRSYIEADDRIRLAVINGSRSNPYIEKDIFQDYDIACFVTDVEPFMIEENVLPFFGEAIIVEQPNFGPWPPDNADGSYHNYNMQLLDGNRIDLTFNHMDLLDDRLNDSLTKVFVDKDNLCSDLASPDESSYYISQPTEDLYTGCCNAFLFAIGSHIPKTIWRKQLPLLKFYTEGWLRVPMRLMISWEIGHKTGFDKSLGSNGRYLEKYLSPEQWAKYLKTYADEDIDHIWESLYVHLEIFTESAKYIAREYNFDYPQDKVAKVHKFLKHVQTLPEDAESIY